MIARKPKTRMKLSDVVLTLKEVKANQLRHEDNPKNILDVGRLYHWHNWNLAVTNGKLYVWTEVAAIMGISLKEEQNENSIQCKVDGKYVHLDLAKGEILGNFLKREYRDVNTTEVVIFACPFIVRMKRYEVRREPK